MTRKRSAPAYGNTLCPKIGAAQWTCTGQECDCHLKARTIEREATKAKRKPMLRFLAEEAECCTWQTGETHGLCRVVRCEHCTLFPPSGPRCPEGHPTEPCSEPDNVYCPTCDTYYDPREK